MATSRHRAYFGDLSAIIALQGRQVQQGAVGAERAAQGCCGKVLLFDCWLVRPGKGLAAWWALFMAQHQVRVRESCLGHPPYCPMSLDAVPLVLNLQMGEK